MVVSITVNEFAVSSSVTALVFCGTVFDAFAPLLNIFASAFYGVAASQKCES